MKKKILFLLTAFLALFAGCGGGDSEEITPPHY